MPNEMNNQPPLREELGTVLCLETGKADPALFDRTLFKPVSELLSRQGKNFRSQLVALGYELAKGSAPSVRDAEVIATCGRVLELLHLGSLTIDDIEDGSLKRRGEPTLHLKYGVPVSINVGNWLYFSPLELVRRLDLPPLQELAMYRAYHQALLRAHMGQALDVGIAIDELDRHEIYGTCLSSLELKTGSLTALALQLGAIGAEASEENQTSLESFGRKFGIALQMFDDLGNARGLKDPEKRWEDLKNRRPTWVWAVISHAPVEVHNEFVGAVRSLPETVHLNRWFETNDVILSQGKEQAIAFLRASIEELKLSLTSSMGWERLEAMTKQLVSAYV